MKMSIGEKFGVGGAIVSIVLVIALWVGWGMNIYKLLKCDFEAPYKTEIIRTIGIVPFVGAFTGYMDIGEEENKN